ncbi:aldehyde-activating protein [Rhizobium sp. Root1203]|uniref:GFA family protein n=1 Tax=Rhizobium sp. Root1203 TaxID=1736427 RepID=UPI00070F35F1|nr:GFA family protein [Rhizobium sp. Root1203]KQV32301.1 aldehyde-activating protein [Rhizobium sp. Root1203]
MRITGQCHCGHVTYQAVIDALAVGICHCTDCQRLTGSPFRVTARVGRDAIQLTGNPPNIYRKRGDSGRIREQHFCPRCGSPLFTTGEGEDADVWGIRWGSIDQRAELEPRRQVWCSSAVPWLPDIAALPGAEGDG